MTVCDSVPCNFMANLINIAKNIKLHDLLKLSLKNLISFFDFTNMTNLLHLPDIIHIHLTIRLIFIRLYKSIDYRLENATLNNFSIRTVIDPQRTKVAKPFHHRLLLIINIYRTSRERNAISLRRMASYNRVCADRSRILNRAPKCNPAAHIYRL